MQKWGALASKKKNTKSLQGARVTQGAFGSNGRGKSGWLKGSSSPLSSRASRTLEATSRLGTDCTDQRSLSPLCKPNAEMGQCCRNIILTYVIIYKSEHVTHHARKVHCFPQSISDVERSGKKYSVRSTTLSPPGCLSPNLSGRREGSVLPFFFCRCSSAMSRTPLVLWCTLIFEIRIWKATNCLLDERVYMSFSHATGFQVYGLSPHHTAAPESRQAARSTWIASRCRGDHHLIGYRWLWWLYS